MKKYTDILTLHIISKGLHIGYTSNGDKPSKRKSFTKDNIPKIVAEFVSKIVDEMHLMIYNAEKWKLSSPLKLLIFRENYKFTSE